MLLTIHDAQLRKVAFVDNEKQGTLDFFDDTWTRNLQTGSSTYEFSISKKSLVSDTVFDRTYSYLNERAFVSFEYKGETFLFNVMTVEEDEKKIKCYCENLNLELINEYSNPFKADRAMSFVEYCNAMDLLNMTKLSVGINEVSDYKRTLEWEGQDTKLARLISLVNKFDAEIEFKTYLNDDSTIKQFLVNVYHENDGVNYHGVGRDRKDITLVYGKNIKTIRRKIDKTNIFNMIVPTAQSEENSDQKLTIGSLPNWELKNDKGIVEFYKRGDAIYAPISAQLYPSTFTSETQSDQWIRRDMEFNVKSTQQLETEGLKQLKASAYPELTYEFDGYIDADIGDTVELSDNGFANTLLIEARIFEQKLSFSTRKNWKTTLGNFRALQSKLSNDIQSELERLVEDAKPYNIRLSTDNGTMFKNNEGESLVKATLWKGGKVVSRDVSWRWALDGNVTVGMQYLVKAKNIKDTAVLTVSAYIGNNEVATTEITLTNVNDGADGAKGDKGEIGNGIANTVITYGLSTSETTEPATWASNMPVLVKGMYLWTRTVQIYTNGTSSTSYQKGYIAKDGAQGLPGTPGKDAQTQYTHIAYADDATGGGFSQTSDGKTYIGMYQDFIPTDSNDPSAYNWSKWKGDEGAPGKPGADGKTSYFHIAYATSADGTNGFSFTESGQQYQGYYTDFTQANSTDPTKYTWMDRRAGVEPGFRNLLLKTNQGYTNWEWSMSDGDKSIEEVNVDGIRAVKLIKGTATKNTGWNYIRYSGLLRNLIKPSTQYVLSFDVMPSVDVSFNAILARGDWSEWLTDYIPMNKALANQWNKVSCVLTSKETLPDDTSQVVYLNGMPTTNGNWLIIKNIKLEEGNVPTPWTPSLEDTQEQIDSKADQTLTQEQLNALAEKNRNMEAEMSAKASLAEIEQWKQAYDSYVAQNDADKTEAEQKLITLTSRIAEWVKDWEDKKVQWSFLDTNMDFGEEGLRLGKKGSPTSILISNDRIGFYSGGSEVASMSNGTLTIDNGIFAKSLQIGHFREEVYESDSSINVIRWVD